MTNTPRQSSECPICGAEISATAKVCPECGADERTGWNEQATCYDGVDLPEAGDESEEAEARRAAWTFFWAFSGILLVIALVWLYFGGRA